MLRNGEVLPVLFNSFEFIFIFLPVVLWSYFYLNKKAQYSMAKGVLVLASLYFYAYFNYSYLSLIVSSILFNYLIGSYLIKSQTAGRKFVFIFGLVANILLLGYFKYYDFFLSNCNAWLGTTYPLLKIVLPLGISFFTFQQLSYIVDCYKQRTLQYSFLDYALFVSFFPQLIAGPIVLPQEMLPQFANLQNRRSNYENLNRGLYLFVLGLGKKVLLADSIAPLANAGFDKLAHLNFQEAWLSSIAYTLQLYFDFSGYCDMAMGIALMFNIVLPLNFNAPYQATNIREFWARWHMTLGRFLQTYLYIPLGGNRGSNNKTLRNLLIVFLVSGLWHGAGWNFILWGALHGSCILLHRFWTKQGWQMPTYLGWLVTILVVNIFWVIFRAENLLVAGKLLSAMTDLGSVKHGLSFEYKLAAHSVLGYKASLECLVLGAILAVVGPTSYQRMQKLQFGRFYKIEQLAYLTASIILLERGVAFLYFNF